MSRDVLTHRLFPATLTLGNSNDLQVQRLIAYILYAFSEKRMALTSVSCSSCPCFGYELIFVDCATVADMRPLFASPGVVKLFKWWSANDDPVLWKYSSRTLSTLARCGYNVYEAMHLMVGGKEAPHLGQGSGGAGSSSTASAGSGGGGLMKKTKVNRQLKTIQQDCALQ